MEKPSLPSIKYILGEADPLLSHQHHQPSNPSPNGSAFSPFDYKRIQQQQTQSPPPASLPSVPLEPPRRYTHHRNSRSFSSMLDFQRLSLAPPPPEPLFSTNPSHFGHSSPRNNQYLFPSAIPPSHNSSRANTSHSRSLSEYSHPYPQPHRSPHSSPPRDYLSQRSLGHRRAVSATTVDSMLNPQPYNLAPKPSFLELMDPLPTQAKESHSPPDTYEDVDSEEDSRSSSPPSSSSTNNNNNSSNRYICPYCSKGFSRPSSLRIHTYSHTGEKPFVCAEEGCGRRFSVQSNMRRHLRVHKLGRQVKKTTSNSQLSQSSDARG
ncbi:hypothetical protein Unana1_03383 [Umbelopsis nana]